MHEEAHIYLIRSNVHRSSWSAGPESRVCTFGLRSRHVVIDPDNLDWSSSSKVVSESFSAAEDEQMAGGWCVKAAAGGDLNVEYAETPQKRVILLARAALRSS